MQTLEIRWFWKIETAPARSSKQTASSYPKCLPIQGHNPDFTGDGVGTKVRTMTCSRARFLLASLLLCSNGLAQGVCGIKASQPCFAEDDKAFDDAKPLSRQVIRVMLRTSMRESDANDLLQTTAKPEGPGSLFKAIPVRLNEANTLWLLAVGTAPPTTGADNGHFWLVDLSSPRPRATMLAPANYVNLLDTKHNGYRDVETEWCSPNECIYLKYKYARGRYRRFRVIDTPNVER